MVRQLSKNLQTVRYSLLFSLLNLTFFPASSVCRRVFEARAFSSCCQHSKEALHAVASFVELQPLGRTRAEVRCARFHRARPDTPRLGNLARRPNPLLHRHSHQLPPARYDARISVDCIISLCHHYYESTFLRASSTVQFKSLNHSLSKKPYAHFAHRPRSLLHRDSHQLPPARHGSC